jgi:rod shape-determining protein MreC
VSGWVGRQVGWLLHGRSTEEEHRRLRAENEFLKGEVARLREAEATAMRLQQQIGFAENKRPRKIAARVISFKPSAYIDSLVIDRGSRDGVHAGMVVATQAGLVGQVLESAPGSSTVLLLTDERSSAGCMIQRADSRAVGVCRGDRSDALSLLYLGPEASVRVGDLVITSGLGGAQAIYPKGVVIGSVSQVSGDATGAGLRVKVRPAVDAARSEEVFVLQ